MFRRYSCLIADGANTGIHRKPHVKMYADMSMAMSTVLAQEAFSAVHLRDGHHARSANTHIRLGRLMGHDLKLTIRYNQNRSSSSLSAAQSSSRHIAHLWYLVRQNHSSRDSPLSLSQRSQKAMMISCRALCRCTNLRKRNA